GPRRPASPWRSAKTGRSPSTQRSTTTGPSGRTSATSQSRPCHLRCRPISARSSARSWSSSIPRVYSLEDVNESDSYFGLIVAARDWADADVAAEALVEHLAEYLPVLVHIVAVVVIEPKRAESSAHGGLSQPRGQ